MGLEGKGKEGHGFGRKGEGRTIEGEQRRKVRGGNGEEGLGGNVRERRGRQNGLV